MRYPPADRRFSHRRVYLLNVLLPLRKAKMQKMFNKYSSIPDQAYLGGIWNLKRFNRFILFESLWFSSAPIFIQIWNGIRKGIFSSVPIKFIENSVQESRKAFSITCLILVFRDVSTSCDMSDMIKQSLVWRLHTKCFLACPFLAIWKEKILVILINW